MRLVWLCLLVPAVFCACPPNTFTCQDGSCIPEDWVGDGEPDCDDRSDEVHARKNGTSQSAKEDDPFDDIITQTPPTSSHEQPAAPMATPLANHNSSSFEDCPSEHQLRIDECSEPVLLFLHDVNQIYFENASLLADKQMQTRVEKGCNLMHEYHICVDGASTSCHPDEGVQAWMEVEMYVCQLLLPAVREHDVCFGKGRDEKCKMRFDALASPFCRLVTSVIQDVECIQQFSTACSDAALEMLPPIVEESTQIAQAIRCPTPKQGDNMGTVHSSKEINEEITTTSTSTTPRMRSTTPTPTTTTTEKTTTEDAQESTTIEDELADVATEMEVETTTADVEEVTSSKETMTSNDSVTVNSGRELKINMSDAVNSMYYIYDICSSDFTKSPFKTVAKKMCERQDEIAKHSDCFQTTLEKEKCATRDATTECGALEAFNANLDCAIVTMNDACEVEAQNMVIEIQESINDVIIEKKCFNDDEKKKTEDKVDDGEFHLKSKLERCEDEQENGALACLVELLEINKQLAQFQNLNFLLEIASPNSTVVANICGLFTRYEQCLHASVFKNGTRCSFASPLNTLARIGLAPICSLDSRPLLASHRDCLLRLADQSNTETNCQSGLGSLGNTVNLMLQGIHGEALLCKSFYLIRDTFSCGERAVEKTCEPKALEDIKTLKNQMSMLGEEEGCPIVPPADLDAIIARPVKRPQPVPIQSMAPKARPLAPLTPATRTSTSAAVKPGQPPVAPTPSRTVALNPVCAPDQQKKFEECVRPLTAFQPHPLSVIKTPRQIDEACEEFDKFKTCVSDVDCHPLWAKGMSAMFEFACGDGAEVYKEVRQCLRKISSEDLVRDCVSAFSRGAPTQACLSANRLLSCSLSTIQTDCGVNASSWVSDYVTRFATAIDARCKLASQLPVGKVVGVGCSIEEENILEHCAAPLNDIGSRMEELFQGGLQSMIKNINGLAPVFAGGCNLTDEFRTCASFILSGRTPCVVSSCMIQAGVGICDQPDPTKAIDENLSCVFGQIQEPSFAKCIRSTLSTVKQFTLSSFRNILPKFIDCTEEIVKAKCGETPIKVLRAMSSPDLCPVGPAAIVPVNRNGPVQVQPQKAVCSAEKRSHYDNCTSSFYSKYRMLPIALINESDNMDEVCTSVATMDECSISSRICATSEESATKKIVQKVCSTRKTFEEHKICLKNVVTATTGASCMSEFLSSSPKDKCSSLQGTAKCMAKELQSSCGDSALSYSYDVMNNYAKVIDQECELSAPSVALATGCSEDDLVQYLTCEAMLDKFSFRPISVIGNGSDLSSFCSVFSSQYKPCIDSMKCRFEPASTATVQLIDGICNQSNKAQSSYGRCLSDYTNSHSGRICIEPMAQVDPLAKEAADNICTTLNVILTCASDEVEKLCGYDALVHVFDVHSLWAKGYKTSCIVETPTPKSVPSNTLDESRDSKPETIQMDETTPMAKTTTEQKTTTESTTTTQKETTEYKAASTVGMCIMLFTSMLFLA